MSNYLSQEWRKKLLDAGFPPADLPTGDAEEILRRLPKSIATRDRKIHRLLISCNGGKRWQIHYGKDLFDSPINVEPDESLANSAASMFVYLTSKSLL